MDDPRVDQTSRMLRELLTTVPTYRGRWQAEVRRRRPGGISRAAVAQLVTRHLWITGERDESGLARELKDRVRRALNGQSLTPETLRWIIDAFDMSEQHGRTLLAALAGHPDPAGIAHTVRRPRPMARAQRHRTISLFERYRLRSDGSLQERRTLQTIVARADGLDAFVFNREPDILGVDVIHGGRSGEALRYGNGLHGTEIILDTPLRLGESVSIEFVTRYPRGKPVTEIRRPAYGRSENIDIAVTFPSRRLPSSVWWCTWADQLENIPLRSEKESVHRGRVRRFSPYIEQAVVGYRWTWER
ncbi:hypothetical protein ACWCHM_29880 [Micromonospora sp. SCSIO 07396]